MQQILYFLIIGTDVIQSELQCMDQEQCWGYASQEVEADFQPTNVK